MSFLYFHIGDDAKPDRVERTAPVFRESQSGTVDVWWLYDDGGKRFAYEVKAGDVVSMIYS
ncbi:hypothetical protein DPMN_013779 [Dreissena polymorpha]|uniref:Uncharacterized protein n=1 Tax=Dreissena polymorpha TaxID=45954 RepID=A0A9D4N4U0_DREPO|nr:hypothetical protein DPMN_013779 [Dreissena polymorpha]